MGDIPIMTVYLERYPQRLPLEDHESLLGFVHRLKDRNDFSWADIVEDLGGQPRRGVLSVDQLRELSRLSRIPFERLASAQHGLAIGDARLYGEDIGNGSVVIGQSRVCVHCMIETEVHLRIWDLKALEICPVHCTAIIDRCPVTLCSRQLSWQRPLFLHCPGGHSMKQMSTFLEQQSRQFGGHFAERVIYETIGLEHGRDLARPELPPSIRDLPLPSFIEFTKFLGVLVNDRDKSISLNRQVGSPRSSNSKLMNAGVRIAKYWPDAFHGLIQGAIVGRRYSTHTTRNRIVRMSQRHIQRSSMQHTRLLDQELRNVRAARG